MAARLAFRVEPPVVAGGEFKRKFLVLEVVLADINVKALGRAVVERMGGDFLLFPCRSLAADVAVLDQLFTRSASSSAISSAVLMDSRWSISSFVSTRSSSSASRVRFSFP